MVRLLLFFGLVFGLAAHAGDRRVRHLPFSLGTGGGATVVLFSPSLRSYADGDSVGTWEDVSGKGNHATASGGARPIYKSAIKGGMPIIRFDGVNHMLDTAAFASAVAQPASMIWAGNRTKALGSYQDALDGITASDRFALAYDGGGAMVAYAGGAVISGGTPSGFVILTMNFAGAFSSGQINGVAQAGLSLDPGSNVLTGLRVGNSPSPFSQVFGGDMGLAIVYPNLNSPLRCRIQQATGFIFRVTTY